MSNTRAKHILLYALGIILLLFGQRNFWEELLAKNKEDEYNRKSAEEAKISATKNFEVQYLNYDSTQNVWKNKQYYFQTLHLGKINFKALKRDTKTTIEQHDDENASDSI